LSPQLFVLAVDTLGRLVTHAATVGILQGLHPTKTIPVVSLYADDVVMFCHPTVADANAVKSILRLFGRASGLQVNYDKSAATLLNCEEDAATAITATLGCQLADLPLTYLGIPLTLRRPTRASSCPWWPRLRLNFQLGSPGSWTDRGGSCSSKPSWLQSPCTRSWFYSRQSASSRCWRRYSVDFLGRAEPRLAVDTAMSIGAL
jgi:hypothetical protein